MPIQVSLPYLNSVLEANGGVVSADELAALYGAPDGIPQLDASGKISDDLLPATVVRGFLGTYDSLDALSAEHPTASYGQYAFVRVRISYGPYNSPGEFYYYNAARNGGSWSAITIQPNTYNGLSPEAKAGQPEWRIVPNPIG